MNNYDSNVAVVLDFLKSNSYGTTAVCAHKHCYKQLKEFLITNNLEFNDDNCQQWYSEYRQSLPAGSTAYKGIGISVTVFSISILLNNSKGNKSSSILL